MKLQQLTVEVKLMLLSLQQQQVKILSKIFFFLVLRLIFSSKTVNHEKQRNNWKQYLLHMQKEQRRDTGRNAVISFNFLVWKFCGKTQFWHSFEQFAQNYAETVRFHKVNTPGNQLKLRFPRSVMSLYFFIYHFFAFLFSFYQITWIT